MRFLLPLLLLLSALTTTVLLPGCEPKEDLITTDSSAKLEFSLDTVKFDTVFVATGTVSKRLWVYNRNARAVRVAEISLQSRPAITYSLLINGDAGASARNVEIRGRDSLLVLVRATIDPTPADGKPFVVEDDLRFTTNGNEQAVKVLSYGQNAYFHDAEEITRNTVWKADKPHVIYNSVLVKPGVTLTIAAGARIYAHFGSFLLVKGRLLCNPDYQPTGPIKPSDPNIVRFGGDRREADYAERPGQWGGIEFDLGSQGNVVRYTEIKNSTLGLYLYNPFNEQPRPQVKVENTELRNISSLNSGYPFDGAALLSLSGDFTVSNTLISNCEQYAVYAVQSSQVQLDYCTIANYSQGTREQPSVLISPKASFATIGGRPLPVAAPRLAVRNSIIWGSIRSGEELEFVDGEQYAGNISLRNSLLKTKKYDNTGPLGQQKNGNVLNPDEFAASIFRSTPSRPRLSKPSFELDTLSPASNLALPLPGLSTDLLNRPRHPATPDIGAYERVNP
ncbi:right-handed parallel beta-helix repeat-containing protein [Hymenobacter actinosclerus]|uniref:Right handed beta helix region n=1 Tax=Hymenobacter actinosclerus TaxID=82805 RepID=A0A1I0I030_9BACT|nr:right-handed parallel beta-helix repeat-containing protein [Hymenobacter actinosclerus]SET89567.1 Right handed beta helix region [Hymenobacter actinosclerus]